MLAIVKWSELSAVSESQHCRKVSIVGKVGMVGKVGTVGKFDTVGKVCILGNVGILIIVGISSENLTKASLRHF